MIIFFTDHAVTIKFNVPWRFIYKELRASQKMRKKKRNRPGRWRGPGGRHFPIIPSTRYVVSGGVGGDHAVSLRRLELVSSLLTGGSAGGSVPGGLVGPLPVSYIRN